MGKGSGYLLTGQWTEWLACRGQGGTVAAEGWRQMPQGLVCEASASPAKRLPCWLEAS